MTLPEPLRATTRDECIEQLTNMYLELVHLRKAVESHRESRYGSTPTGSMFAIDVELYKAAGLE